VPGIKRVVVFVSLVAILFGLILSGLNDTAISIADRELSSSVGSSDSSGSASGKVTITMFTVTDESARKPAYGGNMRTHHTPAQEPTIHAGAEIHG
jgi:hypothetical protein